MASVFNQSNTLQVQDCPTDNCAPAGVLQKAYLNGLAAINRQSGPNVGLSSVIPLNLKEMTVLSHSPKADFTARVPHTFLTLAEYNRRHGIMPQSGPNAIMDDRFYLTGNENTSAGGVINLANFRFDGLSPSYRSIFEPNVIYGCFIRLSLPDAATGLTLTTSDSSDSNTSILVDFTNEECRDVMLFATCRDVEGYVYNPSAGANGYRWNLIEGTPSDAIQIVATIAGVTAVTPVKVEYWAVPFSDNLISLISQNSF